MTTTLPFKNQIVLKKIIFRFIHDDTVTVEHHWGLTWLMLRALVLPLNLLQDLSQSLPLWAILQHQLPLHLWNPHTDWAVSHASMNTQTSSTLISPYQRLAYWSVTWGRGWLLFLCLCSHFKFLFALGNTVDSAPSVHKHGCTGVQKEPTWW